MQAYSDPRRESDPHALPDLEVWEDRVYRVECSKCGDFEIPEPATFDGVICPSCECPASSVGSISRCDGKAKTGWFYWFCFPGCMPDSEAMGPFTTADEALADARDGLELDDGDES